MEDASTLIAKERKKILKKRLLDAQAEANRQNELRDAIEPVKEFAKELAVRDCERWGSAIVGGTVWSDPLEVNFNYDFVGLDSDAGEPLIVKVYLHEGEVRFRMSWGQGNRQHFYSAQTVIEELARKVAIAELEEEEQQQQQA